MVKEMEYSEAAAINSFGSVVGTAYGGSMRHVPSTMITSRSSSMRRAAADSRAFGINSTSMIVGDAFPVGPDGTPKPRYAFGKVESRWISGFCRARCTAGPMASMPWGKWLDTPVSSATAVRAGPSCGAAQTGMIDIGTLGGAYAQAYAINDAGYITGASQTQGMGPMLTTHAFIYRLPTAPYRRYNRMVDLGALGGLSSYGMAINSYNHVAGYSTITTSEERVHAFLHDGKSMIDLGSLGGDRKQVG